jgi:leucyl-tRNA synthetase
MELTNAVYGAREAGITPPLLREVAAKLVLMLAPFVPHIAEELWHDVLGETTSVHGEQWPSYDEDALRQNEIEIVLQINGKVRDRMTIAADTDKRTMEETALKQSKVQELIAGKTVVKVIGIPNKLVNIVVK